MSDMKENLELLSRSLYRLPVAELTDEQLHAVVARAVLARLQPAWQGSLQAHCAGRRAYYFSAEYLLGKAVYNNLLCTGLTGEVEAALTACGVTAQVTQIAVSRTKQAGSLHLLTANNPIFLIAGNGV